jgi:hypothetical protein
MSDIDCDYAEGPSRHSPDRQRPDFPPNASTAAAVVTLRRAEFASCRLPSTRSR